MSPESDLKPSSDALVLMLSAGAITFILASLALIRLRRYYRNRFIYRQWHLDRVSDPGEALVAKMKVGQRNQTVSVFESQDGNRILIEGPTTDREKKRLIRYLKAEGFI